MASSMHFYQISITALGGATDGFIDNQRLETYYGSGSFETTPSGLNLTLAQSKRRANIRYAEIIRQLELVSNVFLDPNAIVGTDATGLVSPSTFAFQIGVFDWALVTRDELNLGQTLTGIACIKRCIARALTANLTRVADVFNPTATDTVGTGKGVASIPRLGVQTSSLTINPYVPNSGGAADLLGAEALVTVTLLV